MTGTSAETKQHVAEARAHLANFEDLSDEEKRGAIQHASAALENARREL
jgi:hypothetical protein